MNIQTPIAKRATVYRMAIGKGFCPHGLKSVRLLQQQGYVVEDRLLTTRDAVEAFKAENDVATTPLVLVDGEQVGGYDDLRKHFGLKVREKDATSYQPVLAVFGIAAAIAIATLVGAGVEPVGIQAAERFIAVSMCLLAMLKLQNIDRFATMFLTYDLLAQRWVRYGYVYPFAEALAGALMIAGVMAWLSVPIMFVIGGIGMVSVIKAVWIDKRTLKCACVGGDSNVPLGFLSLTENVMMVAIAVWMLAK